MSIWMATCCVNCAHVINLHDNKVWWYCPIHKEDVEITNVCDQHDTEIEQEREQ